MIEMMEKDAQALMDRPLFDEPLAVCFVCTGNTCRSPMAAAVLNDMARIPPICSMCDMKKALEMRPMRAISAGLYTGGEPIAREAVGALEEAGVRSLPDNDYRAHRARQLDADIMENCDRVIAMTNSHAMQILAAYPMYAGKISCMPCDIADPFGGDAETYRACLAQIRVGLDELFFGSERE